jgi:hypothetical protein
MHHDYRYARSIGYSRRGSLRLGLLLARLSRNDAPYDTWGRRIDGGARPGAARERGGTA